MADERAWRDGGWALVALFLILCWDFSGLDMSVMHALGGPQGFPWREHWWTRDVLHEGGRWMAALVVLIIVYGVVRPSAMGLSRSDALWWLSMTLLCLVLIPLLKHFSLTSCPWSLAEFGGRAEYVSHWRWGVSDGGGGGCFPSGHAAAAFAFVSGWFVLRDRQPRWARWWLLAVCVIGVLFASAQTLRGAHFPSHSIWTAWICWVVCAGLSAVRQRWSMPLGRIRIKSSGNG
jgi:membrane-associated PAP2 superfamily phosphatase